MDLQAIEVYPGLEFPRFYHEPTIGYRPGSVAIPAAFERVGWKPAFPGNSFGRDEICTIVFSRPISTCLLNLRPVDIEAMDHHLSEDL